ncbi:Por secretion system C-terminal sorting domain-containing protein [Catalinimonas alkaloidigena]|uniref:Por secretion system C-terminal sorting domain-containing protein n=1 Tax=Catalinimonas alkaloidigena TaxID=1075417 RepID=A0A1G9PED4_9BACT|nr:GEVED domain-containing protein [Catalinimonas alkaloidigena]SDL97176.1 Por secretion system C-terminal sorting domain-containing protein [Catalinimonas alkaloidigena]
MKKVSFILLSALFLAGPAWAQRVCATMEALDRIEAENPEVSEQMRRIEQFTQQYVQQMRNPKGLQTLADEVYTIPVVVHVVYRTDAENITTSQIQSQLNVLNKDFRRLNADYGNTPSEFAGRVADAKIEFALAKVSPGGKPTSGITRTKTTRTSFSSDDRVKSTAQGGRNAWPADKYLNIWVCKLSGGLLGYAQFPGGPASTDGVVINYTAFGTNGTAAAPFNKGRTATHEVGHYLNLRHIWGDGGCGASDYVSDTPDDDGPNYGCPSHPISSCGVRSMFMNYMDYVDDACMYMFTTGQKTRMRAVLAAGGARGSLVGNAGGGSSNTPTYCASQGNSTADEWLNRVKVGSINKLSGDNGGYVDFTTTSANLTKGNSYSLTLTPAWSGTVYGEGYAAWIDYNQDGDFDDSGERVYSRSSTTATSVTGSFVVPSGAKTGSTRMRVAMKYNGTPQPCESFAYGEVEDYTVVIGTGGTRSAEATAEPVVRYYPNPARESLTMEVTLPDEGTPGMATPLAVEVFNTSGQRVDAFTWTAPTGQSVRTIDIQAWPAGLYLIRMEGDRLRTTERITVVK